MLLTKVILALSLLSHGMMGILGFFLWNGLTNFLMATIIITWALFHEAYSREQT